MSNRVMQGTYSDFKVIKGRKVIQMVIEFPIEQAESVTSTFGIPQPHEEQWVAVAMLNKTMVTKNEGAMKAIQQAGIMCKDPSFGVWLRDERGMTEVEPLDSNSIAQALRAILGIRSRSELSNDPEALKVWHSLKSAYENHLTT
jgi:hypothetical protein